MLSDRRILSSGRPAWVNSAGRKNLKLRRKRSSRRTRASSSRSLRHFSPQGEANMLNSFRSKAPEPDKNTAAMRTNSWEGQCSRHAQLLNRSRQGRSQRRRNRDRTLASAPACRSSARSNAMVRLRSSAELKASCALPISWSAMARDDRWQRDCPECTVCGRIKGTIRAARVKLQNGGAVEGDIFHRSLSIDENSQFEGWSRRVENPTDPSLSVDGKGSEKEDIQSSTLAPYLERIEESAST